MTIDGVETVIHLLGGVLLGVAWAVAGAGAIRALDRPSGRAVGIARTKGAAVAYLLAGVPYLLVCIALWDPLPLEPSDAGRMVCLVVGGPLGLAGFALYLWGRIALGDMYNVSSSLGSELFEHHRLVVSGPYRFVRHPMYAGIALAVLGALLVYRTWTMVFALVALPGLAVKAAHEDRLLAGELGEPFEAYRARVPGWIPRPGRARDRTDPDDAGSEPATRTGRRDRRGRQEPLAMGGG